MAQAQTSFDPMRLTDTGDAQDKALSRQVAKLAALPLDVLLDERQRRLRGFGVYGST